MLKLNKIIDIRMLYTYIICILYYYLYVIVQFFKNTSLCIILVKIDLHFTYQSRRTRRICR